MIIIVMLYLFTGFILIDTNDEDLDVLYCIKNPLWKPILIFFWPIVLVIVATSAGIGIFKNYMKEVIEYYNRKEERYFMDTDIRVKAIEERVKKRIKWINNHLKLCPCCGDKAIVVEGFETDGNCGYDTVYIQCRRCGLRTKQLTANGYYEEWHTPEEVAELWNRRV